MSEGTGCDTGRRGRAGEEVHWVAREVGYAIPRAPVGVPALPLWGLAMNEELEGGSWCWVMAGKAVFGSKAC